VPEFNQARDYPERYTAFIDVLGFKQKVDRIGQDKSVFEQILGINEVVARVKASTEETVGAIRARDADLGVQFVAFSDSIVLSALKSSINLLLIGLATVMLCGELLKRRASTRGGITIGPLYHRENVVFGKAMIDAYELEQRVARVPRILVHPSVATIWLGEATAGLASLYRDHIIRDTDGLYYVDPFYTHIPIAPASEYMDECRSSLADLLREAQGRLERSRRRKISGAIGSPSISA
jgi:hypothetical protein